MEHKNTLVYQMGPEDFRAIIKEEIRNQVKPQEMPTLVPKINACKRLRKTPQTLDAWVRAGILKKKYIGGRVFFLESDIKRLELK